MRRIDLASNHSERDHDIRRDAFVAPSTKTSTPIDINRPYCSKLSPSLSTHSGMIFPVLCRCHILTRGIRDGTPARSALQDGVLVRKLLRDVPAAG